MRIFVHYLCIITTCVVVHSFNIVDHFVHRSSDGIERLKNTSLQNGSSPPVIYHVWYEPDPVSENEIPKIRKFYTIAKPFTKLWRIMKRAGRTDEGLKIRYMQYSFGKYVTSIGGKREDPAQNLHWILYKLHEQPDPHNPPNCSNIVSQGVDTIRVQPNEVYLFWRNHASH